MAAMPAELQRLAAEARRRPLAPRAALYAALRGGRVTVLALSRAGEPPCEGLEVWAERDPVLGAVWVSAFSGEEAGAACAARLKVPAGQALKPVTGVAAELFTALLEVPCFGGVRLDPEGAAFARLERAEVAALADGLIPEEAPVLRALDGPPVRLPEGLPVRFGEAEPGFGPPGRRACFTSAPGFALQDFRALVELELEGAPAWAPCRNYAAALAALPLPAAERAALDESLLEALLAFAMPGEAEALCARAAREPRRRAWALGQQGRVIRRAGRLLDCVAHCREALAECPEESRLHRSLTLAHAELEDMAAARAAARRGLARFPDDATLKRFA